MYPTKDSQQTIDDSILPFDDALAADNRLAIKVKVIPRDDIKWVFLGGY